MRIIAIDYGKSRAGIAMTDSIGIISQPFLTIKIKSEDEFVKRLKCIIEENGVELVLIGNPLSHDGHKTEMSKRIKHFVEKFKKVISVKIRLWDERFTSKYASKIMKSMGVKGHRNKIDQVAACIMLDEYLKSQSFSKYE